MEAPRNPFILGHRIPRQYFCDRVEEQRLLGQAMANGRNIVMISPRRMGKTSLIHTVLENSEEVAGDFSTFFIDILQTSNYSANGNGVSDYPD